MSPFIYRKPDGNGLTIDWGYLRENYPNKYQEASKAKNGYALNRMAIDILFEIDPEGYAEITQHLINSSKLTEKKS
jgi:hypothetical protein